VTLFRSAVNNVVLNYEQDLTFEHRVHRITRRLCTLVTFTVQQRTSSLLLFLNDALRKLRLLNSVWTDAGPEVADFRRAGGGDLDREHEHGPRRQQEAVSDERRNHSTFTDDEPDLWANGPRSRFPSHRKTVSAFADLILRINVISRFLKAICGLRDDLFCNLYLACIFAPFQWYICEYLSRTKNNSGNNMVLCFSNWG